MQLQITPMQTADAFVGAQVMQLYGTRSLDSGAFLRADYGIQTRDASFRHVAHYQRYASGALSRECDTAL